MFWVALATAIMMLSGEGDDTRAITALLAGVRQAVAAHVPDQARRTDALRAVALFEQAFVKHRHELQEFGRCVDAADRKYRATGADYAACVERIEAQRATLRGTLARVQREYDSALSETERAAILDSISSLPEAWVLDPTLTTDRAATPGIGQRFRGLEGVAAQRHLTLPRNVVSIVYGPLTPATFGQRYPSKIIDGGTSYARASRAGSAPGGTSDEWFTRLGVRFGLFDDFEAGALFLPFELAPNFRFDSVLVFLTQQFRFDAFDLAIRFSFQTPGDTGWALAPGLVLGTHGRRLALQVGAFLPMEVGTFGEPKAPRVGLNALLRVIWNLMPSFFLTGETGVASDDLSAPDLLTIPLGFGVGYNLLAGSRLLEFTASFSWDHWLLLGQPHDSAALQFGAFRIALGASMSFQAL
jgi:hypothetical protein